MWLHATVNSSVELQKQLSLMLIFLLVHSFLSTAGVWVATLGKRLSHVLDMQPFYSKLRTVTLFHWWWKPLCTSNTVKFKMHFTDLLPTWFQSLLLTGETRDVYWLAQCLYLTGQYHRAAHCLESRNLHQVLIKCIAYFRNDLDK